MDNSVQSNTNQQNQIAQKKAQNSLNGMMTNLNWIGFFKNIISFVIQLLIVFIIGSRVVVACKLAQSSLLPTDLNCMPYTDIEPIFELNEPELSVDKIKIYDKEKGTNTIYAKKIIFPFTKTITNNFFIDKLKDQSQKYDISGMKMFLIETLKTTFCWNFILINGLLNYINWLPYETLIILLGPIILRLYVTVGIIIGVVIYIIAIISNIGWLFKKNANNTQGNTIDMKGPKWEKIPITAGIFEFFGVVFNLIGGWIIFMIFLFMPVHYIIFLVCFITPFLYGAKIVDPNPKVKTHKDYNFIQSIKGVFDTKLDIFMILVCFNIINSAHIYINNTATFFVTVASIAFIYWSLRKPKTIPKYSFSDVASDDINGKICKHGRMTQNGSGSSSSSSSNPTDNQNGNTSTDSSSSTNFDETPVIADATTNTDETPVIADSTTTTTISDETPVIADSTTNPDGTPVIADATNATTISRESPVIASTNDTTTTNPDGSPVLNKTITNDKPNSPKIPEGAVPTAIIGQESSLPPRQEGGKNKKGNETDMILRARKAILERKIKLLKSTMKRSRKSNI